MMIMVNNDDNSKNKNGDGNTVITIIIIIVIIINSLFQPGGFSVKSTTDFYLCKIIDIEAFIIFFSVVLCRVSD